MNVLFLTLSRITSVTERGIYIDLMRKFRNEGHRVYIVTPSERRHEKDTSMVAQDGIYILSVKTLNIVSTNIIEKGIGTLAIEYQYLSAIQKYLSDVKFDLVLYSTPPITLTKVIKAIKKRDGAKSYLLLKDIFPQNAVDIGLLKKNGLLHSFFRQKEKKLYAVSDYIGCMSPANVEYVLAHNPQIPKEIIEVCPNCIELNNSETILGTKLSIRKQYNIPDKATIFIYGGNLGKPQGLDFLLDVLKSNNNKSDRFFIVIGSGTEWIRIFEWFKINKISNALLLEGLPKKEYDTLVRGCDVGLIFLDNRFTIPNYPSRLLSYLEYNMPILAATDAISDLGEIAVQNGYGLFSLHGSLDSFNAELNKIVGKDKLIKEMGRNGYQFLLDNYTVDTTFQIIMNHFKNVQTHI